MDFMPIKDRIEIQDRVCSVALNADLGNFDKSYTNFAPEAVFDYSSIFGDDWKSVPAEEFRARIKKYRTGIDVTLHQITNFEIEIDGDGASCRSLVRVYTRVGDVSGGNGGSFYHELRRTNDKWLITLSRYTLMFVEGGDVFSAAKALEPQ